MTLVNRLLDAHPEASVSDRTMLGFLSMCMQTCRAAHGAPPEGYPFRPLFDEGGGDIDQVTNFFRTARFTADSLELAEVLRRECDARAASMGKPGALVRGLREHCCEALVPYLLERRFQVVFLLRDPLDLVASARLGDRGTALNTGWALNARVSVLEMVRQWRKSVALALLTAGHPRARVIRYERFVRSPAVWDGLCRWLGLFALPLERALAADASSPQGWAGNSSFGPLRGLSTSPIGRGALLPARVREFVRAATAPERRMLGYERGRPGLLPYESACEIDLEHVPDEETGAVEWEREATRRRLLSVERLPAEDAYRFFIHPEVHRRLHKAWGAA
jgi:hypothetical protein